MLRTVLTQGYANSRNGKTPAYSFELLDAAGRVVWSGRDFVSTQSREDAIKVARRALGAV